MCVGGELIDMDRYRIGDWTRPEFFVIITTKFITMIKINDKRW